MKNHKILNTYLSILYCKYFFYTIIVLAFILSISNIFDILQKLQDVNLSTYVFWKLVFYKIPYLINNISPLVSFISTLFFINYLVNSNEIIIIIGNGISLQRIICIIVMNSGLIGIFMLTILNPIGAYSLRQHQNIENTIFASKHGNSSIKNNNYFFENYNQENRIIYIESIDRISGKINDIIILLLDAEKKLIKRIDAKEASLSDGVIILNNAKIFNDKSNLQTETSVFTNLALKDIDNYTLIPEMFSIWDISRIIKGLSNAGTVVTDYKIYYYKQLCKPIFMMGTTLLASCLISVKQRNYIQRRKMLIFSLLFCVVIYMMIEIFSRILVHYGITPVFATFLPVILLALTSNLVIMHSDD